MNNSLNTEINKIIKEGWTDGIAMSWGSSSNFVTITDGIVSGNNKNVSPDTIYDIASVSKLFFLAFAMKLVDDGVIELDAQIGDYTNSFRNIANIKIYELLNFSRALKTKQKISSFTSRESAIACIKDIEVIDSLPVYSDMGAITLSVLIEEITNSSLYSLTKKFWQDNHLKSTFWWTDYDASLCPNMQSYDKEYHIINSSESINRLKLGVVHDPKARILKQSGHAGIFSTPTEAISFSQGVLLKTIISKNALDTICSSRYDYKTPTQSFGLLCYKKAPTEYSSEVPFTFSDSAFAMSGYTGTYILIDPEFNSFASIYSNRIYNRCTSPTSSDINNTHFNTNKYVYRKDALLKLL